ncbi:surface antigen msp4 family protein [Desulfuromonas soudanensis]|uniref:Surface antigen msp4 family protein n=1 Tax=Desulfuromonas soudanensis TaxID=1603606 RepID=A0A0M4DKB2_9BACT|nr:outer membrane protein [Desulfuromonas soudanensis]ALC17950.1 surface antigen msp4 family protein [Desulfuromonas soudanensis]
MKRKILGLLATLLASACLASVSFAANVPYLGVQVGGTWVDDADLSDETGTFGEAEFDTGFNVGVTGGVDCGPGRYELELNYRQNDFDKISVPGLVITGLDGDISAISFMANAFWDIPTGSPVTPYLGGGIGVANVSINDLGAPGIGPIADDDDTVFAYQVGAGVAFELNPNMALDLGYRYFATSDPEFTDVDGFKLESEYKTHNASLGLRIMF